MTERLRTAARVAASALPMGAAALLLLLGTSGAIRAAAGVSIEAGLVCAAVILVTIFAAERRTLLSFPPAASAAVVLLAAWYGSRLYHPAFHGLVSVGGGDAGVHAFYEREVIRGAPEAYHSFIVFHSIAHWLERMLGLDTFQSFRLSFYLSLVAFFIPVAVLAAHIVPRFVLLLPLAYLPFERIIMPIVHYLQAEGFFPQLLGLIPLAAAWALYSLSASAGRYTLYALAFVVLTRFTYGLNIPELLAVTGILLIVDSGADQGRLGVLMKAGGSLLVGGGMLVSSRLLGVVDMVGAFVATDLFFIVCGQATIALILLLAAARPRSESEAARRAYRFAGGYVLLSALFAGVYAAATDEARYYLYKQVIAASVLSSLAACMLGANVVGALRTAQRREAAMLAGLFFGLVLLRQGYEPFRPSYIERVSRVPEPKILTPLADREAWKNIDAVLSAEKAPFGGFITPSWPVSSFTNAAFGYFGELPFYRTGRVPRIPGACVFWLSDPQSMVEYDSIPGGKVRRSVTKLNALPGVRRTAYQRRDERTAREISSWCPSFSAR